MREESVPSVLGDRWACSVPPGPLWEARARHQEDGLRDQALAWTSLCNKSQLPLFSREQLLVMRCHRADRPCGDVSPT